MIGMEWMMKAMQRVKMSAEPLPPLAVLELQPMRDVSSSEI